MAKASGDYWRILEAGDVKELRHLWATTHNHLSQPKTHYEAELMMHLARTAADSISKKARSYSHRWLLERGQPSMLPNEFRAEAERIEPVIADSVGISFKASNDAFKEVAAYAQNKASEAVAEMYADGDKDGLMVRKRIKEVKDKSVKEMLGRFSLKDVSHN